MTIRVKGGGSNWAYQENLASSDMNDTIGCLSAKADNETITGTWTFSTNFPVTPSSAPTTNYQVANKKYVDDSTGVAAHNTIFYGADRTAASNNTTSYASVASYTITPNTDYLVIHYCGKGSASLTSQTMFVRLTDGSNNYDQNIQITPGSWGLGTIEGNTSTTFILAAGVHYTKGASITLTLQHKVTTATFSSSSYISSYILGGTP